MIIPILILFVTTLALYWGVTKAFAREPLITLKPEFKFNYDISGWTSIDYLSSLTFINILALIYVAALIKLGLDVPFTLRWSLLIWTGLCTIALTFFFFNLEERYKRFGPTLKYLGTFTTIIFTLLASSIFDADIVSNTHVIPGELPAAQRILTFVGTIYLWAYALFWISIALYPILFFYLISKIGDKNEPSPTISKFANRDSFIVMAVLIGLSFSLVIYMNAFVELSQDLSKHRIKELIVLSSFHLKPEECAIYEKPDAARVALIKEDKAILAIPDENFTYKFTTVTCHLQPIEYKNKTTP